MKQPSSFEQLLAKGILGITVLVSALAMSPSIADPDLWGHVQFGRDFLDSGELEMTTSYSYTANGYRWINHENLSEIVMAIVVDTFGPHGLIWLKFGLSLFVIVTILVFNLRSGTGLIATCLLTILVSWNLGYHWSFRPQLSSFVFFTLMVSLLQFAFAGWRDNWHLRCFRPSWLTRGHRKDEIEYSWIHSRLLWFAPLLFCVWTNSHGGFVAGICVYVAYLGCRALEVLTMYWPKGWGLVRRMALMMLVATLATLLNPYSYRLPMWLLESLGTPRPEILDWSSGQLLTGIGLKFWALVAVVGLAIALSKKSLDFTHLVLLAITLWQATSHFRHVPFFAILAGFWVGPHVQSAFERVQTTAADTTSEVSKQMRYAIVVVMVGLFGLVGYRLTDRLTQLKVDCQVFPVEALQFMHDHGLGGRLVVTYDWAQFAIAALCVEDNLGPQQPVSEVAFDGRFRTCYPQPIVDMHFDLLFGDKKARSRSPDSGPIDPTRVLKLGYPDLVLIRRKGELSESVMSTQTDEWALLFQDGLAQLWGRRVRYDNSQSPDFVPPESRIIRSDMPVGYASWPALPITEKSLPEQNSSMTLP